MFLIEELPLRYYLTRNAAPSLAALGLRAHLDCIAGEKPLLLGISRSSKWYAERPNPNFTRSRELAPDNLPMQIDESSRAGQLQRVLRGMVERGEIRQIIDKHMQLP